MTSKRMTAKALEAMRVFIEPPSDPCGIVRAANVTPITASKHTM
jgi:hypothetical protein